MKMLLESVIVFTVLVLRGALSLSCYKCLNLDCPREDMDLEMCEKVREFVITELRSFYYIDTFLPPCPDINDALKWRFLQLEQNRCGERKMNEATCSVGRFQVLTTTADCTKLTHGTVLGCANFVLLDYIKSTMIEKHQCDIRVENRTQNTEFQHYLTIEHCSVASDLCTQDFCVLPRESVVKSFISETQDSHFEYGLVIGIIIFIIVAFSTVMAAQSCRTPLNRPSNVPNNSLNSGTAAASNASDNDSDGNSSSFRIPQLRYERDRIQSSQRLAQAIQQRLKNSTLQNNETKPSVPQNGIANGRTGYPMPPPPPRRIIGKVTEI